MRLNNMPELRLPPFIRQSCSDICTRRSYKLTSLFSQVRKTTCYFHCGINNSLSCSVYFLSFNDGLFRNRVPGVTKCRKCNKLWEIISFRRKECNKCKCFHLVLKAYLTAKEKYLIMIRCFVNKFIINWALKWHK